MRAVLAILVSLAACKDRAPEPQAAPAPSPAALAGSGSAAVDPWNAPRPPRPAPTASEPFPHPLLWSATKDGKVMHLYGTLHVGIDVSRRLPRWVWAEFDAARVLVQEVDIHSYVNSVWANPPAEQRSLRAALGEARWERLTSVMPTATALLLDHATTANAFLQLAGYGGRAKDPEALPMDADFLVRAKEQAKELVFLETVDEHGAMFAQLYGLPELEALIDNRDQLPPLNARYFDLYIDGERDTFYELSLASMRLGVRDDAAYARHLERLLFARNRAWIAQLEKAHAAHPSGAVFVTVGALHLLGPNSVLALLEQDGFTIALETAP